MVIEEVLNKKFMNKDLRKFCVAPMMGYTTPHARRLYRILSKRVFLFTEMVPSKTLINSTKKNLIIENNDQNPIALQVGGSDYKDLIECAKIAQSYNYDEINLNVGCPSKAVQKGKNGEIYNVGSGKEISINFIANLVSGNKLSVPKRPGETNRSLADISKIKRQLNWKPKITIEKGIEMLLEKIDN